mmetsp:Transcript_11243/g.26196  ORF Transcript_11243/g.26196 Transcript_11243/m.26196 type:complete len:535 (+) Transcript_11243:96-1700(+)
MHTAQLSQLEATLEADKNAEEAALKQRLAQKAAQRRAAAAAKREKQAAEEAVKRKEAEEEAKRAEAKAEEAAALESVAAKLKGAVGTAMAKERAAAAATRVLGKRHQRELLECNARHMAVMSEATEEPLSQLGETHRKQREDLLALQSKALEAVGTDAEARKNKALEHAAGLRELEERQREEATELEKEILDKLKTQLDENVAKIKARQKEELEQAQQAVSTSVAGTSGSMLSPRGQEIDVAAEAAALRDELVRDKQILQKKLRAEMAAHEKAARERLQDEIRAYDLALEAERSAEEERAVRAMKELELAKEARRREMEDKHAAEMAALGDMVEGERQKIVEQHRKELQLLTEALEKDRLKQSGLVSKQQQERLESRRQEALAEMEVKLREEIRQKKKEADEKKLTPRGSFVLDQGANSPRNKWGESFTAQLAPARRAVVSHLASTWRANVSKAKAMDKQAAVGLVEKHQGEPDTSVLSSTHSVQGPSPPTSGQVNVSPMLEQDIFELLKQTDLYTRLEQLEQLLKQSVQQAEG